MLRDHQHFNGKEVAAMLLKKLKSKQGISLPVAMAITAVLIILSASLIAIAASSIMNTSSSVSSRQAYLNVRSALEYAYAYYSDSSSVPDLSKIENEYMVMNDKEGGTTSEGAQIVAESAVANYTTYVIADYLPPSTGRDAAAVKLKAYSRYTDAFGKRSQTVTMSAVFTVNKLANKNRVTLTDIDMDTDVLQYNNIRDSIALHVKQYPGENWTPFYYLWTWADEAEMYSHTGNCYGLEAVYKDQLGGNSDLSYYDSQGNKQTGKLAEGFNTNEDERDGKNKLEPCGVWNSGQSDQTKNGPPSFFSPSNNGWYDATYYIVKQTVRKDNRGNITNRYYRNGDPMKQVNYFNLIITRKGAVLSSNAKDTTIDGVETNEMFHLWYLNNTDRNIYFEFLKPGLKYRTGTTWNGLQELDDRMLVYVKNQKTAVHFKVKGIGDDKYEAVYRKIGCNEKGEGGIEMITPVVNEVRVGGVPIFQTDHTYDNFSSSMSTVYYGTGTLEKAWKDANLGSGGKGDMKNYFYGIDTAGQSNMVYEGCGWWVANVETAGTFSMTITYGDRNGNKHTGAVNITSNSDNEAFVVVDLDRPAILSRLSESRANELIGVDDNSYTTIHIKSSEIGSAVSPYIDYKENNVSSAERRLLLEAIEKARKYVASDYEDASFNALTALVNQGIELYNNLNYIQEKGITQANKDYADLTKKILDAIAALRTKSCDPETYRDFEEAVAAGEKVMEEQDSSKKYDGNAYNVFVSDTGIFMRCRALRESGDILNKTGDEAYTTTMVCDLTMELKAAVDLVRASELNKDDLKKDIKKAKNYVNNTRYKKQFRDELNDILGIAEETLRDSTSQAEIDEMDEVLKDAIEAVLSNTEVTLDTAALTDLLTRVNTLLDQPKKNCTDDSYNEMKAKAQEAQSVFDSATSTQAQIDGAYDKLLAAYNAFTIVKPSGEINENCVSTDFLTNQNKTRIWVKGLNKGTVINGYYDKDNKYVYDNYTVVSFTLDEYIGNNSRGTNLNSDGAHAIEGQNLTYFDIDTTRSNGYLATLVLEHVVYDYNGEFNPSTGSYPVLERTTESFGAEKMISSADVRDNNFVIEFDSLKRVETQTTTTNGEVKTQVINTLNLKKGKLSEYYIKGSSSTSVEVYNQDGSASIYNSIREGDYDVVRFVYNADQTAVVKTYDLNTGEYIYSKPIEVVSGQYVLMFDDSDKQEASILRIEVPAEIPGVSADAVSEVVAKVGNQLYATVFDGTHYILEMNFDSAKTISFIHKYYGGDGETLRETESNAVNYTGKGQYLLQYSTTNNARVINGVGNFVQESINSIAVSRIYPKYSTGSGATATGAGSYTLNGLVSDSLVNSILKAPAVSASVPTPFDFFGQSGVDSKPTQNIGTTIIWIDTDDIKARIPKYRNTNFEGLRVYAWDYNENALTDSWANRGSPCIRVAETNYFYIPLNSRAKGCILLLNGQKIGCDDLLNSYSGNVFFDITDLYYVWHGTGDEEYWEGNIQKTRHYRWDIYSDPAGCLIDGQGMCNLFEVIDGSVLDGSYYRHRGGEKIGDVVYNGVHCYKTIKYDTYGATVENSSKVVLGNYCGVINNRNYYSSSTFYYRAKGTNQPPTYEYEEPEVDLSDMTATGLRTAFVGGTKIRMKNQSYYYSYGTLYSTHSSSVESNRKNALHATNLSFTNLYGGTPNWGNGDSLGRTGDTELTMVYDWYEYKIPVDKTNTYSFQAKGLKYNPAFARGQWYDKDYRTDIQYTDQIKGVYGDVYMVMKDTVSVRDGKFTNMVLYTSSPENIQVNDNQNIYFRLPAGWSANDVKVTASGVGEETLHTFTSEGGLLKTVIPNKTPFLVFQAKDATGKEFLCRTSLQGNDLILFDPTFRAGTGGWDEYIEPKVRLERELYAAHKVYYGYVLPKQYDPNGNAINLGNSGSYDFPEGLKNNVINHYFSGESITSYGGSDYNSTYNSVHNYVVAYTNLYAMMAKARSYISGHNYPEFIHNGKPNIYDAATINELESQLARAKSVYISSGSSVAQINAATAELEARINNVTVSTSALIPIIFYDTQNLVGSGATFELEYSTDPSGNNPVKKKIEYFNTENCPIIFISANDIYNVKFIISGTEEGVEKDHISIVDGAWVYMDIAKKAGVTTSYWVQNAASDYRQIANTEFKQVAATDTCTFDMTVERKSSSEVIAPATTEDIAKARTYRPITFYFKNDVTVSYKKNGADVPYRIRAGAYSFSSNMIGKDGCPINYVNAGTASNANWVPRLNLFSDEAKEYFEDPTSYWKYTEGVSDTDTPVEATSLTNWVTANGDKLTITAGGHNTSKTVNMTVNDGYFAATRVWNYLTPGKMYFRWEGNKDLRVDNNVSFSASEIVFASSGTVNVKTNYNKHIFFQTKDRNQTEMEVVFPTDLHIEYIDRYREEHSFTIREGSYTVEKADPNQSFICDLCDEEYWESMVHVKINNRYDSLGGFSGSSNKNTRFGSAIFSND